MTPRSYLFVPGTAEDRLPKALTSGAGAVIVDLEDGVALADKDVARAITDRWLAALEPGTVEVWVRVNADEARDDDVTALAGHAALTGFCLPQTDHDDQVASLAALLDRLGAGAAIEPFLESAEAIANAAEIAAAPRVRRLHVGEIDLVADLGVTPSDDESELLWARSAVVAASARAGVPPPIAPVSREFRDLDAFHSTTQRLLRLGFWARDCIHPAQIGPANDAFTPPADRVEWAADVVRRLADAGGGVTVDGDGRLVDEAVARIARRVLAQQG